MSRLQLVPFRSTNGAKEHGFGPLAQVQRVIRKWMPFGVIRTTSDQSFFEDKVASDSLEHLHSGISDLWTNAVARQDGDEMGHRKPLCQPTPETRAT